MELFASIISTHLDSAFVLEEAFAIVACYANHGRLWGWTKVLRMHAQADTDTHTHTHTREGDKRVYPVPAMFVFRQ